MEYANLAASLSNETVVCGDERTYWIRTVTQNNIDSNEKIDYSNLADFSSNKTIELRREDDIHTLTGAEL